MEERIGDRVRRVRQEKGLTQEEVARRAGLGLNGVTRLELGYRTDPHYSTLQKLSRALDVPVSALIGEEPATIPKTPAPSSGRPGDEEQRRAELKARNIGARVRQARENEGISQMQAAREADMSPLDWSKIERGIRRNLGRNIIAKVSSVLHTDPEWIRTGRSSSPRDRLLSYLEELGANEAVIEKYMEEFDEAFGDLAPDEMKKKAERISEDFPALRMNYLFLGDDAGISQEEFAQAEILYQCATFVAPITQAKDPDDPSRDDEVPILFEKRRAPSGSGEMRKQLETFLDRNAR